MAGTEMSAGVDHPLLTSFGRLVEVFGHLERRLGKSLEEECDLPHVWFEVLLRLARSPDGQLPMGRLADQVVLTTGGVTRLVDRMEQAGYVERRGCLTDRRIQYATITAGGRRKLEECAEVHLRNLRELYAAPLTEGELATLDRLLDKLRPC